MNIQEYFKSYAGKFLDVKLNGRKEYIKMVFRTIWKDESGFQFISADIVPDNNEEHYLSQYLSEEVIIERIMIQEDEIENIKSGRNIPGYKLSSDDDE